MSKVYSVSLGGKESTALELSNQKKFKHLHKGIFKNLTEIFWGGIFRIQGAGIVNEKSHCTFPIAIKGTVKC